MLFSLGLAALLTTSQIHVPKPLASRTLKCTPSEYFGRAKADPIVQIKELQMRGGFLHALFFLGSFAPTPPAGHEFTGSLYYQFDDDEPTYLSFKPPEQALLGYFMALHLANVALGRHRLSFALVDENHRFVSYGQRCFKVTNRKYESYDIHRLLPEFKVP